MSRLCKNCKHFRGSGYDNIYCRRPFALKPDLVTGEKSRRPWLNPYAERKPGRTWFGFGRERCGPSGKFWEPFT